MPFAVKPVPSGPTLFSPYPRVGGSHLWRSLPVPAREDSLGEECSSGHLGKLRKDYAEYPAPGMFSLVGNQGQRPVVWVCWGENPMPCSLCFLHLLCPPPDCLWRLRLLLAWAFPFGFAASVDCARVSWRWFLEALPTAPDLEALDCGGSVPHGLALVDVFRQLQHRSSRTGVQTCFSEML